MSFSKLLPSEILEKNIKMGTIAERVLKNDDIPKKGFYKIGFQSEITLRKVLLPINLLFKFPNEYLGFQGEMKFWGVYLTNLLADW